jgi:hypothetical protein
MTTEIIGIIIIAALSNLVLILGGVIHLTNRITEIGTDVKWIKKNCPVCGLKDE